MARVLGVGGVMFRSKDVTALRAWYERVLGLTAEPWGGVMFAPLPRGVTVWAPFPAETEHFAPSTLEMMLNFVVDDLQGVLAKAAAAGVTPMSTTEDETGRFASVMDPDGRKVELWEPARDEG